MLGLVLHSRVFPFVIIYWGSRGGGLRLAREAILEIAATSNQQILTSIREELIRDLIDLYPNRIINCNPVIPKSKLATALSQFKKKKTRRALKDFLNNSQSKNVLIVMPHPWDISLSRYLGNEISIYRIIHDIKRHPGDFWPNGLTIRRIKKDSKLIALSNYTFNLLPKRKTIKASLARLKPSVEPTKPPEVGEKEMGYILVVGRNKRYQQVSQTVDLISSITNNKIITNASNAKNLKVNSRITVIKRWVSDPEIEYLISHAGVVICLYREASQSGVVEQAKYWGTPVIVSNKGALPEQIMGRNNCYTIDSKDETALKKILESALSQPKLEVNWNKSQTVIEALKKHYFDLGASKN
jgi:glycosyltransferase involved in cell wall biosynthesis